MYRGQWNCAADWSQASEPTTDLIVQDCFWSGYPEFPPPLPLPDGPAIIGLRNGVPFIEGTNDRAQPNWKEYAGTCLRSPMLANETYIFEFYMGFTAANSPPMRLSFFGAPSCSFVPFGEGNAETGCPTNVLGWQELASLDIAGSNEWQLLEIEITPTEETDILVFGPDCALYEGSVETIYFFDRLTLARREDFELSLRQRGHPCSPDFFLAAPTRDTLSYQWYRDGVALAGETNANFFPRGQDGRYQVRMLGPSSCSLFEPFNFSVPVIRDTLREWICQEDSFLFGNQDLVEPGVYRDTTVNNSGCDSITVLELNRRPFPTDTIAVSILPGELYVNSALKDRPE
ncbi:MAG: gliding motility-associated C-terminal domain-containing protein, partial [Bacteroidota bacterium]